MEYLQYGLYRIDEINNPELDSNFVVSKVTVDGEDQMEVTFDPSNLSEMQLAEYTGFVGTYYVGAS